MKDKKNNRSIQIAIVGIIIVMLILVLGTVWMGQRVRTASGEAVRTVSLLYLDELAGRREQVVADNLQRRITDMQTALELMTDDDLRDMEHLQAYQAKMKRLFTLQKFAFIDGNGLIYTSLGTQTDIDAYRINYLTIDGPEITIKNLENADKTVVIALPVDRIPFNGEELVVCFMEIDMKDMLAGVSMQAQESGSTFTNIYTRDGVALSNTVLGGLAVEDNLLAALSQADYEDGYSFAQVQQDFESLASGVTSFSYNGIRETLSYVPVEGTDWLLTYLIRESVISEQIGDISNRLVTQSVMMSVLVVVLMLGIFLFIIAQNRRNARLLLEKETADAELRGKEQELNQRIALQKQLEEQSLALNDALAAAEQANKAKTVFLSNMSHEIRTPMNAIIGLDNIALNDPETPEKTKGYLTKIGTSAEHLLTLINDILDMSRIESGRMALKNEAFSFAKLLEYVNTMISGQCQEKGLQYQCHINGHMDDWYIGDNMKLRQVLLNILGNAVKFTPAGGRVDFDVARTAQYDGKSTLTFRIADTGIGMNPEFLPHIFDAFAQEDGSSTSRYGSSGLGLAITKNIVELMNGNIRVESEKDVGTTFTVAVTLMDAADRKTGQESREIRPQDMSVLIIDDDSVACEHAKLVLEKVGIAAETAASGAEAIEMVRLRQARMTPYNLILVDWQMPEMDGVETTRRIRELVGNESAIIILTAYRWDDVLEEATQAGVDSFIAKPLFAANVLEEFESAVKRKGLDADSPRKDVRLEGRRILLAEDMAVNAEIMKMVLQAREIETDPAENGRIAVEKFAAHPAGYYDAILMDMRMPEMDGLEATKTIRAMERPDAKTVPIIALTANAFDEDVQRSLQAGLNAHLSKPVEPERLYATLAEYIAP